jgi:hypothetical protein
MKGETIRGSSRTKAKVNTWRGDKLRHKNFNQRGALLSAYGSDAGAGVGAALPPALGSKRGTALATPVFIALRHFAAVMLAVP